MSKAFANEHVTPGADLSHADAWQILRQHTPARIALGRAGAALPTAELLRLGLAQAQARDAVHTPLDFAQLHDDLQLLGWQALQLRSQASDRASYLLRPDLGRRLHPDDAARLRALATTHPTCTLAVVVADGLSSAAVQQHAAPLLTALQACLQTPWDDVPIALVAQGRVAVGDEIGAMLGASLLLMLIGERPGLSSPASLGAYMTHDPRPGRLDSQRNCVSNIRPEGLPYAAAAYKIAWLANAAMRQRCTGVALKDDSATLANAAGARIPLI